MKRLFSGLVLSVAVCAGVYGQTAFYNNGTVTVQGLGYIYVNGNMQIDASGTLSNDGTVEVTQNYENDRTDGAVTGIGDTTTGVVKFSGIGNLQQLTAPNSSVLSFNGLETVTPNVFAAGTLEGGVESTSDIMVNGTLIFGDTTIGEETYNGQMVMNTQNLTIGVSGTITGGDINHYAYFTNNGSDNNSGTFSKLITSSSTGPTPTFPYYMGSSLTEGGPAIGYVPASFNLFSIPTQANKIAVAFYPMADIGNVLYVGQCNLPGYPGNNVMINEMIQNFGYWQIDVTDNNNLNIDNTSGWLYNATLAPTDAALTYLNTNYGTDYFKILKMSSHDGEGNLLSAPTSSTDWSGAINNSGDYCDGFALINNSGNITTASTSGITATNLSSFSRFGGGGNGGGSGLPITLVSLVAVPVDNSFIRIDWTTAIEVNNAGFEVQKSLDGVNFGNIGWVAGSGNSTEPITYYLDDKEVSANVAYYYRLNQVDMNGNSHISNIVTANIGLTNVFTVSDFIPNPSSNSSKITVVSSAAKSVTVTLYNTLGQKIAQKADYSVTTGSTDIDFDLSSLATGSYYAEIVADNQVYNKKLIVNK